MKSRQHLNQPRNLMPPLESRGSDKEFDVLISFAGPERAYAHAIHDIATANGLRVFLDAEFQHEIWGNNLVEYLDDAYRDRGRYVLALISKAYCDGAFPRVERRAAFDQMLNQAGEFLLPVKVDDSWIPGLPKATAYLDLRVHGVLGICELLARKILNRTDKLVVPTGVIVPRVPLGCLPAEQLAAYLSELCARPLVTVFGTLIYDEGSVSLRKLLRDTDYWDALNIASGPHFEVFAIRDTEGYAKDDGGQLMELMTAASMSRSRSRGHYFSTLLKTYFHEPKTRLAYPSMLIFFVEQRRVMHCWLIPLPQAPLVETFEHLKTLFSQVADGIQEAGGPAVSSDTLRNHLRQKLLEADYTLYRQAPPSDAEEAVHKLVSFVER